MLLERDPGTVRALLRRAYIMHSNDQTINPTSCNLECPDKPNRKMFGVPAAILTDSKIIGLRWACKNENNNEDLYTDSTVVILNDYETGLPIAFLDGSVIRATRIALSTVLAAELLQRKSNKKIQHIGIVGTGYIIQYLITSLLQNSTLAEVKVIEILEHTNVKFEQTIMQAKNMSDKLHFITATNLDCLVKSCELIIFATEFGTAKLQDLKLLQHNPIIINLSQTIIGANIILASNNITDDIDLALANNSNLQLAFEQAQKISFINGEIGSLLQHKFSIDYNKPTIFSPAALGVLDLILAQYVYQNALSENKCTIVKNFSSAVI